MATTGTYAFDPQIADIIDEASERAGIDPATLGQTHLKSIFRSMRFMLNSEWSTLGVRQWMIQQTTQSLVIGDTSFNLPVGSIDVLGAVLRRDSRDTEMYPISRNEYLTLVDKTDQGRPNQYFVDRQYSTKVFKYWQPSQYSGDAIVYDLFRQIQDVGTSMQNTLQIPVMATDAMTHGLAVAIAGKWNRKEMQRLREEYRGNDPEKVSQGSKLGMLLMEDRERGDLEMRLNFEPRTSRR